MAEKPSGPLKPPTLDMQARKPSPRTPSKSADAPKSAAESAKPASENTARVTDTPAAAPNRPAASHPARASAAFPLIPAALSAIAGAAVAVLIILGLAASGILANLMPQTTSDQTERLTFAEEQVSEALVGFNALNRQFTDLQTRLDSANTNVAALATRQDDLETSLADLPAPAEAQPVDLAGVQTQIDQLGTRIAALQSGASPAEADSLTGDLSDLQANLSTISDQMTALEGKVATLGENLTVTSEGLLSESAVITSLQADVELLKTEPNIGSTDSQLLRLPLALSGLETALDGARPFSTELLSLLTLVPDLSASESLTIAAETGLPAPGRIVTDFSRAVPAIMAARPTDPDAGMMDNLWSRAQALLAIRPTGETGDDPVSDNLARAEAFLANRQFTSAAAAIAQLPAPMQEAAGDTLTSINLMAEAEGLLANARASVLAASGTSAAPTDEVTE